jgi:hypothetical protein
MTWGRRCAPGLFVRRNSHFLSLVALVSGIYDVAIGVVLLVARDWLARTFGVPPPQPPIFVELDALFLLAVGVGYVFPYLRPDQHRGYMWVMGPGLKGVGSLTLVVDHFLHGSPAAFLLFAVTDGALALVTLAALLSARPRRDGAIASPGRVGSPEA